MRLDRLLSSLGYCSRKEVRILLRERRVQSIRGVALKADSDVTHDEIIVDGAPLDPPQGITLMLHKPVGFTVSRSDEGQLVYELLPARFEIRRPLVAPIGRLDKDSSGLLLFTDDGTLAHRIMSPRRAIEKHYRVTVAEPLRGDEAALFASGTLMLENEHAPLLPARLIPLDTHAATVIITEGRYHQVRRMFAAIGNHVETLERFAIGGLQLGDLPSAEYRMLNQKDIAAVLGDQSGGEHSESCQARSAPLP